MVISSLLSSATGATSLADQVQILIFLLIVTLVVALFSRLLRVPYTLLRRLRRWVFAVSST